METVFRDYAPKGVRFYYVYKTLSHPELDGYVNPFTLDERLMHIREAERKLGSRIPWLCDSMSNDLKHALGNANNSEWVIDPEGRIARMRLWSDPAELRKDLEQLVGTVERPTQLSDLELKKLPPAPKPAARGVVSRVQAPGRMLPVQVRPIGGETPFYVKLRAEADESLLRSGTGTVYLGFHLDPLYGVHWNNLVDPVRFEIRAPEGVKVTPASGSGPKVETESDVDPREFLLQIGNGRPGPPLELTVRYFACTDEWCKPVTQRYEIRLARDPDAGAVMSRNRPGGPGAPGSVPRVFEAALGALTLTEAQTTAIGPIREAMRAKARELMQRMRESSGNPGAMQGARREMMLEMLEDMREVLDAEQYEEFEKKIRTAARRPPGR